MPEIPYPPPQRGRLGPLDDQPQIGFELEFGQGDGYGLTSDWRESFVMELADLYDEHRTSLPFKAKALTYNDYQSSQTTRVFQVQSYRAWGQVPHQVNWGLCVPPTDDLNPWVYIQYVWIGYMMNWHGYTEQWVSMQPVLGNLAPELCQLLEDTTTDRDRWECSTVDWNALKQRLANWVTVERRIWFGDNTLPTERQDRLRVKDDPTAGIEVTYGPASLDNMRVVVPRICDLAYEEGADFHIRAGTHIHIGAHEFNWIKHCWGLANHLLVPVEPHRYNDSYNEPLIGDLLRPAENFCNTGRSSPDRHKKWFKRDAQTGARAIDLRLEHLLDGHSRTTSVNLHAIHAHNTIEFRSLESTSDGDHILRYMEMLLRFRQAALAPRPRQWFTLANDALPVTDDTVNRFCDFLDMPEDMEQWYRDLYRTNSHFTSFSVLRQGEDNIRVLDDVTPSEPEPQYIPMDCDWIWSRVIELVRTAPLAYDVILGTVPATNRNDVWATAQVDQFRFLWHDDPPECTFKERLAVCAVETLGSGSRDPSRIQQRLWRRAEQDPAGDWTLHKRMLYLLCVSLSSNEPIEDLMHEDLKPIFKALEPETIMLPPELRLQTEDVICVAC